MRNGKFWYQKVLLASSFTAMLVGGYACDDDDSESCTNEKPKCENDKYYVCVDGFWNPTNSDCNNSNGNEGGGNEGGGNEGCGNVSQVCEMLDAGQACSACTPVCSADGSTAYLCNTKTRKSMKWTCDNNDCAVNGSKVTCTKPGS